MGVELLHWYKDFFNMQIFKSEKDLLLFYLGSFYCFLFCPKSARKATRTKVM